MSKEIIETSKAPEAIGPYSQAIRTGELVFCSGQIPLDPATDGLVEGPFADQARRCLENLGAVLEAAGTSWVHVLKATVYLTDMSNLAEFNRVYEDFVGAEPPARAAIGVADLPRGVPIEVECIARV